MQNQSLWHLCDGFIIVGGGDVNPAIYKQVNTSSNDISDYVDELDLSVISYAVENTKPLMGICRGIQIINVFFHGSLKQDIPNHQGVNHHIVQLKPLKKFPKDCIVNSYHHQSIDKLGYGLIALYESDDQEIEVIIHEKLPIIAVQFHPEIDKEDSFSKQLIDYFNDILINY